MAEFFTASFKRRMRAVGAGLTMLVAAGPFGLGLLALTSFGVPMQGWQPALITVAAFLCGTAGPWLCQNWLGLAGNARLRRQLAEKWATYPLAEATFVGFAPGQELRAWEGETDRDIGFLWVEEKRLVYRGDEYVWALPREAIDHIDLTPIEGPLARIFVYWHEPAGPACAFSLASREANSLLGAQRRTRELFERLRSWQRSGESGETASEVEGAEPGSGWQAAGEGWLGPPPTEVSGAPRLDRLASGSCISMLSLGVIIVGLIWRLAGECFTMGRYYEGVLWAGLISVSGALVTGYVLHYLQAWEAAQGPSQTRSNRP